MDWKFFDGDYICQVRAAGILLKDGKLLVQREGNVYSLPGGHLMAGELTADTVVREFREELDAEIKCGRLLFTEEVFWDWDGKKTHELGYYYLIESASGLPDTECESFLPIKDNASVSVGWVSLEEISNVTLYPDCLKEILGCLPNTPLHFVRK